MNKKKKWRKYLIYKIVQKHQKLLNDIIEKEKEKNENNKSSIELINEEDIKDDDIKVYGDEDDIQTKGLIDDSPKNNFDNEKKMELENGFIEDDNDIDVVDNLKDKIFFDKKNSDEINDNNKKENKINYENEEEEEEKE